MGASAGVLFRDFGVVAHEFRPEHIVRTRHTFTEPGVLAFAVVGGTLTIEIDGRVEVILPGESVVFLASFPHRFLEVDAGARLYSLHVPVAHLVAWVGSDRVVGRLFDGELLRRPLGDAADGNAVAFRRWCATLHSGNVDLGHAAKLEIEAWMNRFFDDMRSLRTDDEPDVRATGIAPALQFIARRFADPISVDDIAEAAGWPRDRLMTAFRRVSGVTLWQYVIRVRLAEARRLLRTTDLPIETVSERAGFGSVGRLYDAFRRAQVGTPAAYRSASARRGSISTSAFKRTRDDVPLNVIPTSSRGDRMIDVVDFTLAASTMRDDGDEKRWVHLDGTLDVPRDQAAAGVLLSLCLTGALEIEVGGRVERAVPGEIHGFWGGMPHRLIRTEAGTVAHGVFVPVGHALSWVGAHHALRTLFSGAILRQPLPADEVDAVTTTFGRWPHDLVDPAVAVRRAARLEVQACFERFVASSGTTSGELPRLSTASGVAAAMRFIAQHYTEPLTVEEIASAVGWSTDRFTFAFREVCGLSVRSYLTSVRLGELRRLLVASDLPMLTLCHRCGFASITRMYDAFRRAEGMTPAEYRASMRAPGGGLLA